MFQLKRSRKNKVDEVNQFLTDIEDVKYAVDQMIMFTWYGDENTAEYIYDNLDEWGKKTAMFILIDQIPVQPLEPPDPVPAIV